MEKYIIIRTQFEALHKWEDCPYEDVSFLRELHRHIFHVEVKAEVTSLNREIEFIRFKRKIEDFLQHCYKKDIGNLSCEMLCEIILNEFPCLCQASVFEDNENGAMIKR